MARQTFKVVGTASRLRYTIDGAEVTPAFFSAALYDQHEALPSNANISLTASQLATLAAQSCEFSGHASDRTYTSYSRWSRLVQAVKNSDALSTKAV